MLYALLGLVQTTRFTRGCDFMQMVLEEVENGISDKQLSEKITLQIAQNSEFYEKINRQGTNLCKKYDLNYDGKENPFIK